MTEVAEPRTKTGPGPMPVPKSGRNPSTSWFEAQVAEPTNVGVPALPSAALTRKCSTCDELYPGDFLVCPRDATPLVDANGSEAADPLIGKLLGETYRIVRVVGEGGMGRVY